MIYTKGQVVRVISASCGDSADFLGQMGKISHVELDGDTPYLVKFYEEDFTTQSTFRHKEIKIVEDLNDDIVRLEFFNRVKKWEG